MDTIYLSGPPRRSIIMETTLFAKSTKTHRGKSAILTIRSKMGVNKIGLFHNIAIIVIVSKF